MKKTAIGCFWLLNIISCSLSGLIVNGYRYEVGKSEIYFFSDAHYPIDIFVEEDQSKINDAIRIQVESVQWKIVDFKKKSISSFVEGNLSKESEATDDYKQQFMYKVASLFTEKFSLFQEEIKKNGTTLAFRDEAQIKEEIKNVQYFLDCVKELRSAFALTKINKSLNWQQIKDKFIKNREDDKNWSLESFKNELDLIKNDVNPVAQSYYQSDYFTEKNVLGSLIINKKYRIFRNLVRGKVQEYRNNNILKFIEQERSNQKNIIFIFAGDAHIQSIRKKFGDPVRRIEKLKNLTGSTARRVHSKEVTINDIGYLIASDFGQIFKPLTLWENFKLKALSWKKYLIPTAVAGAGLIGAAYWWKQRKASPQRYPKIKSD